MAHYYTVNTQKTSTIIKQSFKQEKTKFKARTAVRMVML